MILLLDAHLSGRVIADAMRDDGHDVAAIDADPSLEGMPYPEVLRLAVVEQRILVTANVRDFVPLLAEWLGAGRSHTGCVLIPRSVRNEDFSRIIAGLRRLLHDGAQSDWTSRTIWLRK